MIESDYLLVAIDGTWSSGPDYTGGFSDEQNLMSVMNRSYTVRFHARVDIPGIDKFFHHGPESGVTGADAGEIAEAAWRWLTANLARSPDAKVILVGHSRGGHIVTDLAIRLSRQRQGYFGPTISAVPAPGEEDLEAADLKIVFQPVHFLGLYDAVDMTGALGDTSVVPGNVEWFFHARRDERVGSHGSWGNAATMTARRDPDHYHDRTFLGTHGAMGGAIPEGCGESAMWGSCEVNLTVDENRAAGESANAYIIAGAMEAGIPIRNE
ncbi:MAG: hypothetical protein JWO82_3882 [Akkermansiaceae bacterium]|nr:hypothetical protein [Akkermansiaceae bacterium]